MAKSKPKAALISCGIFKKEIEYLINNNSWNVKPVYLDSSLHVDFDRLWATLTKSIEKNKDLDKIICYGTCHPLLHKLMKKTNSKRVHGQNCVDLILGRELFDAELEKGAFFLFEDWALNWNKVTKATFGNDDKMLKLLFTSEHNYLLAIKTPCSNDFSNAAEKISLSTGLNLKWINVDLNNFEERLKEVLVKSDL